MDPVAGVGSAALDLASSGASAAALYALTSSEQLMAQTAAELFASLGLGATIDASA